MESGKQSAARVIAEMVTGGAGSRKELERALGLSKAAISRTVGRLLSGGFLEEGAKLAGASRGRKTMSLRVRPDLAYVLGTDLEGRAIRACVLDCSRQVVAAGKRAVGTRWSVRRILRQWVALVEEILRKSGVPLGKVAGLGVGLPGVVLRNGFRSRAYLPPGQWVDLDPAPALARLNLPLVAANNVICVSDYERRLGAAFGIKCFLSVLARYGLGAAIYERGEFLMGDESFACEFGHMRINLQGPRCICGRKGCLDVYVAGRTLPPANHRKGRAWRGELMRRGRALGIAIANLIKVFHAPLVILNGVYNDHEAQLLPQLRRVLQEELSGIGLSAPSVAFGEKVEFKSSIGAALRAGDAFLQEHLVNKVLGTTDG